MYMYMCLHTSTIYRVHVSCASTPTALQVKVVLSLVPRLSPHKCHSNCVTFDRMHSTKFARSKVTTLSLHMQL